MAPQLSWVFSENTPPAGTADPGGAGCPVHTHCPQPLPTSQECPAVTARPLGKCPLGDPMTRRKCNTRREKSCH